MKEYVPFTTHGEMRNEYTILVAKTKVNRPLGRLRLI
jgi:hypothetical protein